MRRAERAPALSDAHERPQRSRPERQQPNVPQGSQTEVPQGSQPERPQQRSAHSKPSKPSKPPKPPQHPYFAGLNGPRILAHRGFAAPRAAEGVVENTRAAFAAAEAAGADMLESDCRVTSDGEVVLFHDATLERLLGDQRPVSAVSRRELAELLADRGGLLTLEEALDAFPRARLNLDVKAAAAADRVGRIVAPHAERVLLTSFSDEHRLRALRAAERAGGARPATAPGRGAISRAVLAAMAGARPVIGRVLRGVDALQIPERRGRVRVLTPRLLDEAHRRGVEVHVWTVDDPERMRRLVRAGVDGVVTDRTDLAVEALRS